jgi:hypothetical protein
MDNHSTTRQQRRAAERQARKQPSKGADRADLIPLFAAMAEATDTLSGVTIIMPGGKPEYLDAGLFRRGGTRA